MQKNVAGPFIARNLGAGTWHLSARDECGPQIYLRGAGPVAPELLQDADIAGLLFEWREDGVRIAVSGAAGIRYLAARTAVIHEPLPLLYQELPLAGFDADAKRFWRRVFGLMRIPGGRLLLRYIAQRGVPKRAKP